MTSGETDQQPQQPVRIARARLTVSGQLDFFISDPAEALVAAFEDSSEIEWRGRSWRLGGFGRLRANVPAPNSDVYFGRLGFRRPGARTTIFDAEVGDFIPTPVASGDATPFALRLPDRALVFQTKQDISVEAFTGALRVIARERTGLLWRTETLNRRLTFRQWRESVTTVNRLTFRLEKPNPDFEGRPDIENIVDGMNLDSATVVLRSDGGVRTDAEIARQMLDHTVERGYGDASALGERVSENGERRASLFESSERGESEVVERYTQTEGGNAPLSTLVDELSLIETVRDES